MEQTQIGTSLKDASIARKIPGNCFFGTQQAEKVMGFFRAIARLGLAMVVVAASLTPAGAQASRRKDSGPTLIRDAEIEGLMRLYAKPIFKAAGIDPNAVKVYLLNDRRVNAFVAGGQRIFVNTGTIVQAKTPNEVIGILAHETGHIAGGHLARMGIEMDRVSTQNIIGTLLGAAAMVGGAAAGNSQAARAGGGIVMGSQGMAQRSILAYQRDMESSADQAALKYLAATGQSPKGMLDMFQRLANASIATAANVDPYLLSHPMPLERIRNLEAAADKSPNFDKPDEPALVLRHRLAQAKLIGFTESTQVVYQKYPSSDTTLPGRYARAIAMYRRGDMKNAMPVLDGLIRELPQDPYFWELKGQALLESGQAGAAMAPLAQARKLLPNNGLIQMLAAQAYLDRGGAGDADQALKLLSEARRTEGDSPIVYKFMAQAYGLKNDVPRAELATAEYAFMTGDKKLAVQKARALQDHFKHGSPEWLRANDIVTFAGNK